MLSRRKAVAALAGAFVAPSLFTKEASAQPQPIEVNPELEKLKNQADAAYRARKFARCIELASQVLRKSPKDHVALYLRGSARVEKGVVESDGKLVRAGVGDARLAVGIAGQEQVMYYLPYLYGMTSLAQLENTRSHAESARKFATKVLGIKTATDDDRAHIFFQRGNASSFLSDHNAAANDYNQAIRLSKHHLGAHLGLAESYARAGKSELAKSAFDKAAKHFPDNPLVFNNRGMFLQKQGKLAEAVLDFTRAVEVDAEFFQARTNRGFVMAKRGDFKAAEADYTASLKSNPSQPLVLSLRGACRLDQGKLREAVMDYRAVVARQPKNPMAHADLGFAYFYAGDFRSADSAFRQALTIMPRMTFLRPWLYLSQARRGVADARGYRRILPAAEKRGWPDHVLAYLVGEIDSKTLLTKVSKINAKTTSAHTCEANFFIGQKQLMAGKRIDANNAFDAAIATKVDHLSAYRGSRYARGKVRTAQK